MIQRILPFFYLFTIQLACFAQDQDPKAKLILDELSKKTKAYTTMQASVKFQIIGKDKKPIEKPQTWTIQLKSKKFKVLIPGTTIVCDGTTLWNFNQDAQELTIKTYQENNEEQNPAKMFTMYETGYKYKYSGTQTLGGVVCDLIDLYPTIKPERKKFHTVKMWVDSKKKQIKQLKLIMKDGSIQVFEMQKLESNLNLADAVFTYDTKGLKPDQINDERD